MKKKTVYNELIGGEDLVKEPPEETIQEVGLIKSKKNKVEDELNPVMEAPINHPANVTKKMKILTE